MSGVTGAGVDAVLEALWRMSRDAGGNRKTQRAPAE
jgi:hypothetical protein